MWGVVNSKMAATFRSKGEGIDGEGMEEEAFVMAETGEQSDEDDGLLRPTRTLVPLHPCIIVGWRIHD